MPSIDFTVAAHTRGMPHRLFANAVAQAYVTSLSACNNVLISITVTACHCNKRRGSPVFIKEQLNI